MLQVVVVIPSVARLKPNPRGAFTIFTGNHQSNIILATESILLCSMQILWVAISTPLNSGAVDVRKFEFWMSCDSFKPPDFVRAPFILKMHSLKHNFFFVKGSRLLISITFKHLSMKSVWNLSFDGSSQHEFQSVVSMTHFSAADFWTLVCPSATFRI